MTNIKIDKLSDSEYEGRDGGAEGQGGSDDSDLKGLKAMNSKLTTSNILERASTIFSKAAFYKLIALILLNKFRLQKVFQLKKLSEILRSALGVSLASIIFLTL